MGIFRGSNGGIVLTSTGGLSLASNSFGLAPATPSTTVTLTWAGTGDETRGNGGVTEGTAGDWNDGTSGYANLFTVINAQSSDTTIQLPAGDFAISSSTRIDFSTVSNDGLITVAVVGTTDGNGDPTTCLKSTSATGSPVFEVFPAGDPRTMHLILKDLELGQFQSVIDAWDGTSFAALTKGGQYALQLFTPCRISFINCRIRGLALSGVAMSAAYEEYVYSSTQLGARHVGSINYYDGTETYLCGTSGGHGTYCHGITINGFRSKWHNVHEGHCLKLDGNFYFEDCEIENAWANDYSGVNNGRPININGFAKGKFKDCVLKYTVYPTGSTPNGRSLIYRTNRINSHWGYSNQVPAWWVQDKTGTGSYGVPTSRALKWTTGGYTAPSATYSGAVRASYTAGSTSIDLGSWSVPGREGGSYNSSYPTNTGTDYYTVVATDGVTIERKTVTLPSAVTSTADTKTATLESGGFSFNLSTTDAFVLYETSAGPDTLELNPEFWDQNDANYYWDKVNSGGSLIKTSDAIENIQFEGCMFIMTNNHVSDTNQAILQAIPTGPFVCMSGTQVTVDNPFAPADSPVTDWSNVAGAAQLNFDSATDLLTGDEPSSADVIFPSLFAFGNSAIVYKGTGSFAKDGIIGTSNYSHSGLEPTISTISGGTVTDAGSADGTWMPTENSTTTNGAASSGASSIVVTSATGFSAGKCILLYNASHGPTESPVHQTTIGSGYVSGTTIPLDDNLPWALASGSDVVVTAAMGTKPSWWLEGVSWVAF